MTRHRNAILRNVIRRLRPSPSSIAAAAAAYDPALLLAVQASERRATGDTPARELVSAS